MKPSIIKVFIKISWQTNIAFGLIFSVCFWFFVDGTVKLNQLLIVPCGYVLMIALCWFVMKGGKKRNN